MSKVATLLADPAVRLLTLLGPGGIGKTRLALEVAATQLARFPHGVYFVSLAGVDSGYSIIPLIANTLGFSLHSERAPHRQLGDYLQEKKLLLVLDNCEHLIDFATAQRLTAESITLYERLEDRAAIAHGQLALSWLYLYMGRFHEAYAVLEQATLVFEELRLPAP